MAERSWAGPPLGEATRDGLIGTGQPKPDVRVVVPLSESEVRGFLAARAGPFLGSNRRGEPDTPIREEFLVQDHLRAAPISRTHLITPPETGAGPDGNSRFLTSGLACWNRQVECAERASEPP